MLDAGVEELVAAGVGRRRACVVLGRSPASHYRHRRPPRYGPPAPRPPSSRALSDAETEAIMAVLNSERFCDRAPAQVWATLLDEGTYLGSVSTMYRILRARAQVRERRRVARRPTHLKPELVATGPNQVWSWDITKLAGPHKWSWYHLYVILDVYSRYAVAWLVAPRESGRLAEELIASAIYDQGVAAGQLSLHADRGSSMTSKTVTQLLADLGVLQSHSRPHQSNDNPYSESNFKTLKYFPSFPRRFAGLVSARSFVDGFFAHYNNEHRHSGIALHTPADVHYGRAPQVRTKRQVVLDAAYAAKPGRFRKPPSAPRLPEAAWINQPEEVPLAAASF
ncbi:MAG TPA: IS3 family transposase [Acidimicrobiales bacterium]|nr:IS3 family transposase [Acidimicrobiales bacterium]